MSYHAILKARSAADSAHRAAGQTRMGSGAPYITHCAGVARHVRSAGGDLAMIQAAYLHDAHEDTALKAHHIDAMFGTDVGDLVRAVSTVSHKSDGTRAVRKAIDRKHFASGDARAQTIKLADILDNVSDISTLKPSFAKIYLQEKQDLASALTKGSHHLRRKVMVALAQARRDLDEILAA